MSTPVMGVIQAEIAGIRRKKPHGRTKAGVQTAGPYTLRPPFLIASGVHPTALYNTAMEMLQLGILWYTVFIVSLVCHEAAHALAALRFGDPTAWQHGLATLNPVPHIQRSPMGMVLVPLLSFIGGGWMIGWASVPYDLYWAHQNPRQAAWMSLAGPAANLSLAVLAGVLIHIGIAADFFVAPDYLGFSSVVEAQADGVPAGLAVLVSILFSLNLLLMVFNLIPVAPLDGTALAEFVLKDKLLDNYRTLMDQPNLRVIGLFVAWYVMDIIFSPVFFAVVNLLYYPLGIYYG